MWVASARDVWSFSRFFYYTTLVELKFPSPTTADHLHHPALQRSRNVPAKTAAGRCLCALPRQRSPSPIATTSFEDASFPKSSPTFRKPHHLPSYCAFRADQDSPASMSFQHRNLAEVWQHLEGRHDLANILREIIGQHSVETTLQEDVTRSTGESVRTVIWIKTIFDLQRCYFSGNATGVAECPPYVLSCLLPPELLFSSILYLINIKTRLFSSHTTLMTREFTRPRHILAQTILSGLRLLLLRKESLATNDKRRLQNAINMAWQDDRLLGVERFIVSDLFAGILDSINDTSRENPYHLEWTNAKLPTYAAGLVRRVSST